MTRQYNAGTAHVDIRPKFDTFAKELRDKMRKFDPELEVKLEANTDQLVKKIRSTLATVDEHTITLKANTDHVDNAIGDLDDSEITIRVFADAQAVKDTIAETIPEETTVKVHADTDDATTEITKIAHHEHTATITATAETRDASDDLDNAAGKERQAHIWANANTFIASRQIEWAARDRIATIHVYANTREAFKQLSQLKVATLGIGKVSLLLGGGGAALGSLGALATGALAPTAALATNLATVAHSLAVAPALMGAFGTGLAGMIIGFQGVGGALGAIGKDAEALEEALANLTPNAQQFVRSTATLKDEWQNVRETAQEALFEGIGPALQTLGEKQLPTLAAGLQRINAEIAAGAAATMATLSSTAAQEDFRTFLNNSANMFTGASRGVNALAQSWIDLATVGSQYLPSLGATIGTALETWTRNLHGKRLTGELQQNIEQGISALHSLGNATTTVGSTISGVWRAMNTAGQPFIHHINEAAQATERWVNSAQGQETLVNLFTSTSNALGAAMPVISAAGKAFTGQLIPAFAGFVENLAPGAAAGITHLGNAFEKLSQPLATAGASVGRFIQAFGNMAETFTPVVSTVLNLVDAISQLAPVVVPAAAALTIGKGIGVGWNLVSTEVTKLKAALSAFRGEAVQVDSTMTRFAGRTRVAGTGIRAVGDEMRYAYMQARGLTPTVLAAGQELQTLSRPAAAGQAALVGMSRAMTGVKTAASGLVGALGGPWGVAIMAATAAIGTAITAHNEYKRVQQTLTDTTRIAADAQTGFFSALANGNSTIDVAKTKLQELANKQQELTKGNDFKVVLGGDFAEIGTLFSDGYGAFKDKMRENSELYQAAEQAERARAAIERLGVTTEQAAAAATGSNAQWRAFKQTLIESGEGGAEAAAHYQQMRDAFLEAQAQLEAAGPAGAQMAAALQDVANQAGTAAERLDRYRLALAELQGLPISAAEAQKQLTNEIANASGAMEQFNGATLDMNGYIDTSTKAGVALHDSLMGIGNAATRAAESGKSGADIMAQIGPALEQMRQQAGISEQEWQNLLDTLSLTPDKLDILAQVNDDEAKMALNALTTQLDELQGGKEITVSVGNEEGMAKLKEMGFEVDNFNTATGMATVSINDAQAAERLEWWTTNGFPAIDMANPTAEANLDATGLLYNADYAKYQLDTINLARPNPLASMDITQLDASAIAALQQVGLLDGQTPTPAAYMNIDALNAEQQNALARVFDLNAQRPTPAADLNPAAFNNSMSGVEARGATFGRQTYRANAEVRDNATPGMRTIMSTLASMALPGVSVAVRVTRTIRDVVTRADGGPAPRIINPPAFANGGLPGYTTGKRLPTTGPGTDIVDGFIGIDSTNRPFVRVDAGEWIVNRRSSKKYNNLLQAINRDDPRLQKMGDLPAFRVGGIATSDELKRFVHGENVGGFQAKQPLEQAPYVWGGVNWGDCSGAMSAIARFAKGLDPFAGRFATANEQQELLKLGFQLGHGSAGDLRIGWKNGGPGGGHTSGTLPDGTNVEMGGGRGNGQIGGPAAGANHPQFTNHAYLPIPTDTYSQVFEDETNPDGTYKPRTSKENDTDRKDALKKLEKSYARMDKLEADLPELERAVEVAEFKRNETYNKTDKKGNPTASATAKLNADEDVRKKKQKVAETKQEIADLTAEIQALERQLQILEEEITADPTKGDKKPQTFSEIAGNLAQDYVAGNTRDLLGILGISDELPGSVKAMQLYNEANGREPWEVDPDSITLLQDMGNSIAQGDFEAAFQLWDSAKREKVREREAREKRNKRAARLKEARGIGDYAGAAYEEAAISKYNQEQTPSNGNPGHIYDPTRRGEQWRDTMIAAYNRQGYGYDQNKIDAWIRQIDTESGGDPNIAQQIVDINGTGESAGVGLGQMIPTTFAAYRDPELPDNRRDPWAMTNAMVRYGERKYGDRLLQVIGQGRGYANGGDVWGRGTGKSDDILAFLSNGEHVIPEATAKLARPLLNAMDNNPALGAAMNALYQNATNNNTNNTGRTVENHYHIETNNLEEGLRHAELMARRAVTTMGI